MDSASSANGSESDELRRAERLEEFVALLRDGRAPSIDAFLARFPDADERLHRLLATASAVEGIEPDVEGPEVLERIGEFRIERELGRGGMGVVLLAEDERLGRRVALKLLPLQAVLEPRFLERFRREARAAARLEHPGIVRVYGVGQHGGYHYFAMEYVDGHDLHLLTKALRAQRDGEDSGAHGMKSGSLTRIARELWTGQPSTDTEEPSTRPPLEDSGSGRGAPEPAGPAEHWDEFYSSVAHIGEQVAQALSYAHSHGIVHRDIKPSNLILGAEKRVWITDFGLCRTAEAEHLTDTHDLVGTLRYMAPEQTTGRADVRSDVYGIGITLHQLLALRAPYAGGSRAQLLRRVVEEPLPRLSGIDRGVPRDLEAIVLRATAKLPEERYGTAAALADDLRAFLEGRPVSARVPSFLHLLRLAVRRHRVLSTTIALALFAVALSTVLYLFGIQRARKSERRQLYLAHIAAVETTLPIDPQAARQQLDDAPPEHRGWEWDHYDALLRDELATFGDVAGRFGAVVCGERTLAAAVGSRVFLRDLEGGAAERWVEPGGQDVLGLALCEAGGFGVTVDRTLEARRFSLADPAAEPERYALPAGGFRVACAPDGGRVFVGLLNGGIHAFDPGGIDEPFELIGHGGEIWGLDVSPDGARLVSGSLDGSVRLWDVEERTSRVLLDLGGPADAVTFDAIGAIVAVGAADGTVRLIDARTGEEHAVFAQHMDRVTSVDFSPDGRWLASGSRDKTARLWDLELRQPFRVLRGYGRFVTAVAFDPGGRTLYTGTRDGSLKAWDVNAAGGRTWLRGHVADVFDVALSRDGSRAATSGRDGTVRVFDAETGRPLHVLLGHRAPVFSLGFSPAGDVLASGDWSGVVILWDVEHGVELQRLEAGAEDRRSGVSGLEFGPAGSELVAGLFDHGFRRFAATDAGWRRGELVPVPGTTFASVGPAGRVAVATSEGTVQLFEGQSTTPVAITETVGSVVRALDFQPGGDVIASGADDGTVRLWSFPGGRPLSELQIETPGPWQTRVSSIAFDPSGERLACASVRMNVSVWDVARRELVTRLRGIDSYANAVAFGADGTRVAAASISGLALLWDTTTAAERAAALDRSSEPPPSAPSGSYGALSRRCRELLEDPASGQEEFELAHLIATGLGWHSIHPGIVAEHGVRGIEGEAAYRVGNFSRARRCLEQAVQGESSTQRTFEAYALLAMARARLHSPREAAGALARAREIAGRFDVDRRELLDEAEGVVE